MASFKDVNGTVWEVSFTIGKCRTIKSAHKIDFVNAHDAKAVTAIEESDELMVAVLWMLCEEQAQGRGMDETAFAEILNGDVLADAQYAIEEALIFFSRPERRDNLRAMFEKKRGAIKSALRMAMEDMQKADLEPEIRKQLDALKKNLTDGK